MSDIYLFNLKVRKIHVQQTSPWIRSMKIMKIATQKGHVDNIPTPPSLHFLRSKFSIFRTTYPLLNSKVICEGSLSLFKILHWLKIRGGWISAWEMPFLFSSRKKKTPSAKSERHVPSPENNSRGFRPNLSTTIAAATVTATYR